MLAVSAHRMARRCLLVVMVPGAVLVDMMQLLGLRIFTGHLWLGTTLMTTLMVNSCLITCSRYAWYALGEAQVFIAIACLTVSEWTGFNASACGHEMVRVGMDPPDWHLFHSSSRIADVHFVLKFELCSSAYIFVLR